MSAWLEPSLFTAACSALPLVSIDLYVTRPSDHGQELLLGLRNNRPAQGWWFTPGGRIRKNESIASAMQRIAQDELGLDKAKLDHAKLLGAWDHFYPESAFDERVSTHYVNLPYWLALDSSSAQNNPWPTGKEAQHSAWRWVLLQEANHDDTLHINVKLAFPALLTTLQNSRPGSTRAPFI